MLKYQTRINFNLKMTIFIEKNQISKTKKNLAFTLAEVLITLGIIGIVAEMTIPALIQSYQKVLYYSAFKKGYSQLSQVVQMLIGENNGMGVAIPAYGSFTNAISAKVKIIKTCPAATMPGECMPTNGLRLDNVQFNTGFDSYDRIVFIDGQAIQINIASNSCSNSYGNITNYCGQISLDTNGISGPNQRGRDIFYFILANDRLYAKGAPGLGSQEWSSSFGWYCDPTVTDPNSGGSCGSRLLQEGAMKY